MDKPKALRLAEFCDGNVLYQPAAAELRRLHAENERLSATVKAREDEILTHSEAFYEATRLLSEAREKNERLAAALASSCDEQRHELWESGGVAGCERARVAERQRDALLASLRVAVDSDLGRAWVWPDTAREQWMRDARAAIAAVEGEDK